MPSVVLLKQTVCGVVPRVAWGINLVVWTVRAVLLWIRRRVPMAQQQMITIAPFVWIMLIADHPLPNVLNGARLIRMNVFRDVRLNGLMAP